MQTIRVKTATAIALVAVVGLLARAQAPDPSATPAAPELPTPAETVLDTATIKVRLMDRIAAKVVQNVDMLNQQFTLTGEYFKDFKSGASYKDTMYRVRLELNLDGLGNTKATMLQVCDGKILWDYQKVLASPSYRKREITPILERLDNPVVDPLFRGIVIANMGFGGPRRF